MRLTNQVLLLILILPLSSYAQSPVKSLIETPILKTEKETNLFLKGVLNGVDPAMKYDGDLKSYDLDNAQLHFEYKIHKDTCVMAFVRFKTSSEEFDKLVSELTKETKELAGIRVKEFPFGQRVYYHVDGNNRVITLISHSYALTMSRK